MAFATNREASRRHLGRDEVHVWYVDLVSSPDADTLSVDERERAGRFHADRDRDRFVAAHAAWRQILSAYLPVAPASLDFARTASGKPYLSVPPVSLQFSGSHSGDTAAIARVISDWARLPPDRGKIAQVIAAHDLTATVRVVTELAAN